MKYTLKFIPGEGEKDFWLKIWRIRRRDNFINWIISQIANGNDLTSFVKGSWMPRCYSEECREEHHKTTPAHGSCCTCQQCGHDHDSCKCQYFEEPCSRCPFIT